MGATGNQVFLRPMILASYLKEEPRIFSSGLGYTGPAHLGSPRTRRPHQLSSLLSHMPGGNQFREEGVGEGGRHTWVCVLASSPMSCMTLDK